MMAGLTEPQRQQLLRSLAVVRESIAMSTPTRSWRPHPDVENQGAADLSESRQAGEVRTSALRLIVPRVYDDDRSGWERVERDAVGARVKVPAAVTVQSRDFGCGRRPHVQTCHGID